MKQLERVLLKRYTTAIFCLHHRDKVVFLGEGIDVHQMVIGIGFEITDDYKTSALTSLSLSFKMKVWSHLFLN